MIKFEPGSYNNIQKKKVRKKKDNTIFLKISVYFFLSMACTFLLPSNNDV